MQRGKIRRWLLVVVAVLAAASMFPSLGGSAHRSVPPARHATLIAKHQGATASSSTKLIRRPTR
jgi:hypothetical protein